MKTLYGLLLNIMLVLLTVILPVRPLISPANATEYSSCQIGQYSSVGSVEYFVGIDYRMEIAQLFETWLGQENPEDTSPEQMLPLRRMLLDDFSPYSNHPSIVRLGELEKKYRYSFAPETILLNAGELPVLEISKDWFQFVSVQGRQHIDDPVQFNADISDWVVQVNDFICDSAALKIFGKYESDYRNVLAQLAKATDNCAVIAEVISLLGFSNISLIITPSPLITPGRNYSAKVEMGQGKQVGYYYFGPFKEVPQDMFKAAGWNKASVTFEDQEQFMELDLHEMIHLLIAKMLLDTLENREAEIEKSLIPIEERLAPSYGQLKGNAMHYIDELATRAITLELVRRYVGMPQFRVLATREIGNTRGYAVLLWRYIYQEGLIPGDPKSLEKVIGGIPGEIRSWDKEDQAPFTNFNEYTATLSEFVAEFVPSFYGTNPKSFGLFFVGAFPEEWKANFRSVLSKRLGLPQELQEVSSSSECPFTIEVRMADEKEFQRSISWSGINMSRFQNLPEIEEVYTDEPIFSVAIEQKDDGVRMVWSIFGDGTPLPEQIVPWYFVDITHAFIVGKTVIAYDSLTAQTRLVTSWINI